MPREGSLNEHIGSGLLACSADADTSFHIRIGLRRQRSVASQASGIAAPRVARPPKGN
jgi:hypothetical protein